MEVPREPLTGPPVSIGELRQIAETRNGKLALGAIGVYMLIQATVPTTGLAPMSPPESELDQSQ